MEQHGNPEPQCRPQDPPAKRRRIGYACDLCRIKKMRCDGERPSCGPCKSRRHECVYSPQRTRVSIPQDYVEGLRARNRALEEKLANQHGRDGQSSSHHIPSRNQPLTTPRSMTSDGSKPADQIHATFGLSQRNHRPSIDDRPSSRGHPHQRLQAANSGVADAISNDKGSPAEYYGEASAFNFIAKVGSPDQSKTGTARDTSESAETSVDPDVWGTQRGLLRPVGGERGGSHVHSDLLAASSPSTVVFEDLLGIGGGEGNPFELPQRQLADKLVASFFYHRHILNPYLHEGTFRRRYERLWMSREAGGEEATSANVVWLGLVNMVFAFGSEHVALRPRPTGTPSSSVAAAERSWHRNLADRDHERFFRRAKTLILSGILQTGKIELVQALLLLGHYLHGSLELNHCWTVVGLAVRTAQELGLYLDPARTTRDVVEQEIHKRVWWGCFALDRLISTKLGRPPVIHDGPQIRVDLPLPVDDEYLNEHAGYRQPDGVPSKLEYFRFIISHCRLVERVLNGIFKNGGSSGEDAKSGRLRVRMEPPDLLAMSIQLDGALTAWQDGLPAHLRPESEASEWAFQRQRSVLLMRFLHLRLLIHRQTLLLYISRPVTDQFQLELMLPCIKRCVLAASESITQMRFLRQHNSLSSFWHNSHYIFAALGVLLVFQKIDPQFRAEVGIPASPDLDELIGQGLDILQRVGGEMHPLATRYVQSFEQLRARLRAITIKDSRLLRRAQLGTARAAAAGTTPWTGTPSGHAAATGELAGQTANAGGGNGYAEDTAVAQAGAEYGPGNDADTAFLLPPLDDELAILRSVLLDGGEWPGFADLDWQAG
ncbi:hypothetical protein CONLIGDRAFT_657486 [Coniochaeta ligniaria NRRL 30616]|uniref:Zn(2)-C6 fungal-type domain-containing protein n=1 Tax=Coniochaeta ligniaria NRRL 30616 TaxID=1408157 RepID=A0A1J7J432_9PEZI|nr:hypothetical protein CONLIGDRAFT_657486 [Coniochaeta ligniaria NRRL 30616]